RDHAEDAGIVVHPPDLLGPVVRIVRRDDDRLVGKGVGEVFEFRRLVGEGDADGTAIFHLGAVGRVVHLELELAAGGEAHGGVGRADGAEVAGSPAGENGDVAVGRPRFLLAGLQNVDNEVVHDGWGARHAFGDLDPLVLLEAGVDDPVLVG